LIRKKNKLSQEAFGERIGVTKTSISKIESGVNNPSEQTIQLICSEFSVNKDWLLTGVGGEDNMYIPSDMRFLQQVGKLGNEKNEFKKFYLNMMMQLPDEYWDYIYGEFKKFAKEKGDD
jgi:transcriptional regulator with XRE-family HTH domain